MKPMFSKLVLLTLAVSCAMPAETFAATPSPTPVATVSPKPMGVTAQSPASATPLLAPKLQPYVDDQVIAGAVMLVADKDRIVDLEAVGFADIANQRKMQVDDVFWIASMSKSVTAAAFMMLVDERRVSLDDPVQKYIPEFANVKVPKPDKTLTPPAHAITIREILSHTGGMHFLNRADRSVIDSVPLATSIEHDLLEPLHWEPGTKYSYSNEGIDTAGRIIEIVTGMPYEKFLQDRLFIPLGMVDTTFWPSAAQIKRLAKTYTPTPDKKGLVETTTKYLTYPLDKPGRYPAPGGGLFSTARDVNRFCQMLLNDGTLDGKKYLSKQAVRQMTTKQTGPNVPEQYGLGVSTSKDGLSFGHGGALKTNMTVDHGQIRIFLVQHTGNWPTNSPGKEFDAQAKRLFSNESPNSTESAPQVGTAVPTH